MILEGGDDTEGDGEGQVEEGELVGGSLGNGGSGGIDDGRF